MKKFDSLIEAINYYKAQGNASDFLVDSNYLLSWKTLKKMDIDDFIVESIYRFEGDSDPTEGSIMYPIRHKNKEIKGLLWNLRRSRSIRSYD